MNLNIFYLTVLDNVYLMRAKLVHTEIENRPRVFNHISFSSFFCSFFCLLILSIVCSLGGLFILFFHSFVCWLFLFLL